jgi:hypothetical protein
MVNCRKWRFLSRIATVFLTFLIAFPAGMTLWPATSVQASDWAGWDAINTIYYNPAQEDAYNTYLATVAGELETYLEQMSGRSWNITTGASPASPTIYLTVDATAPDLDGLGEEAYHIVSDANGISITGHTALATRHGAYELLDRLGVRWFFKNDAWTVVPDSLADLGALNVIDEPDYFWRGIRLYPNVGQADAQTWGQRNRTGGAAYYFGGHSYAYILDETGYTHDVTTYNAHPDWFLPTGGFASPWQLNPADDDIIGFSENYAVLAFEAEPGHADWCYGDNIPRGAVSITPNDGGGWNPPYSDKQDITDLVFGLSNTVALSISQIYPGKYVATPSYASYSEIPSIELEPNVLVHVATAYNYSDYTIAQRVAGITAQGGVPGIRDYVDIWQWYYDAPSNRNSLKVLKRIPMWLALGAQSYEGEVMDNWGGRGHIYYALSRLLWDASLDLDDIFNDFYTKAFGPAAATMQTYYETRSTDNASLAESFRLLHQAETEAAGNDSILARIRQMECYTYFTWKFNNIGIDNLSNAELEDFYTFLTKIRDWYLVTYIGNQEYIANELTSRGYSAGQITALQDFTTPTDSEVAIWMSEALGVWVDYPYISSDIPNPFDMSLVAYGDTVTPSQTPIAGLNLNILVPCAGGENVSVRVKGSHGTVMWYDSSSLLLDYFQFTSPISEWTSINFTAYIPDTYVIHVPTYYNGVDSSGVTVEVQGRTSAILAAPGLEVFNATDESPFMTDKVGFSGNYTGYFYVPEGTDDFTLGYAPYSTQTISGRLTDPNGGTYNFSCVGGGLQHGKGGAETVYASPVAGLWKIEISVIEYPGYFWFIGIPPLVWNDPEYLAVQATGPQAPPDLHVIGSKTVGTGQRLQFIVFATDPNGDHLTYSAANLPPWATFNAITRTFSGTPNQSGTYHNVHFEVTDGSTTDAEDITINVIATQPDVNGDGVVNILDIIGIVQHWNESDAPGWIPQDINNDGIINVLDIALIGQYWTG